MQATAMPRFILALGKVNTWWIVAGAAVLSLLLRSAVPVRAIGPSGFDDLLFIKTAGNLIQGRWLGSFDNLTLAKGMMYPVAIAAAYAMDLPLKLLEQLVYIVASGLAAWALVALGASRWMGVALFLALQANPFLWNMELA